MKCPNCFNDMYNDVCDSCGNDKFYNDKICLRVGTVLNKRYHVGLAVSRGGFGIVYKAYDVKLNRVIAIKEYYPSNSGNRNQDEGTIVSYSGGFKAQYEKGLVRFIEEAELLAKFNHLDGITKIFDIFEGNNTAYIVMELIEGETLLSLLKREGNISFERLAEIVLPVIEVLEEVHKENIIHRDISPDNIFLTNNNKVKLIDFGAARHAATGYSKSLTDIVKPGYAPLEQYSATKKQGPWTDVYALCATMYRALSGKIIQPSIDRAHIDKVDDIIKVKGVFVSEEENIAIMNGLVVDEEQRPFRTITEFKNVLLGIVEAERVKIISKDMIHKKRMRIITAFSIAVLLTFGGLVKAGVFLKPPERVRIDASIPEDMINVPNLVGKTIDEVVEVLDRNSLLVTIVDKQYDKYVPMDMATLQYPYPGVLTQKGSTIQLVISKGKSDTNTDVTVMSDYEFQDAVDVRTQLEARGLSVKVVEQESNIVALGKVISTSLDPGSNLEGVDEITVYVSKGKNVTDVSNIVGKTESEAKQKLESEGFMVYIKKRYDANVDEGLVISQDPNGRASAGSLITVVVSLGRGEGKYVTIPSVINMTEEKAIDSILDSNLSVKVNRIHDDNVPEGMVIKQDPEAGVNLPQYTENVIVVSLGIKKVVVPDVVDQKETIAKSLLAENELEVSISYIFSNSVGQGKVVSQSIDSGEEVPHGEVVSLVISKGAEWSQWSTTKPSGYTSGNSNYQKITQYSSRNLKYIGGSWSGWVTSIPSGSHFATKEGYSKSTGTYEEQWSTASSISGWTKTSTKRGTGTYIYGTFSEWSTSAVSSSSTREVKTRTVWQYSLYEYYSFTSNEWLSIPRDLWNYRLRDLSHYLTGPFYYTTETRLSNCRDVDFYKVHETLNAGYHTETYRVCTDGPKGGVHANAWGWFNEKQLTQYSYRSKAEVQEYKFNRTTWSSYSSISEGATPSNTSTAQYKKYFKYQERLTEPSSSWTSWSNSKINGNTLLEVKTRALYRYKRN